ncbi:MAG TPA: hypothetical protein PKE69_07610 [Pyrinomonadaceae bacterium]|nr:hypothetical protein [Pyrinomonadaceae bacterium]
MRNLLAAVTLLSLVISLNVIGDENIQAHSENTLETQVVSNVVQKDYGKKSLIFEENKGQTDREAIFISRGQGYTL